MSKTYFTSESVCAGHPDKIADAISDTVLDAYLEKDRFTKAGIETVVGANQISLFGEVSSNASVEVVPVVRQLINGLGYTNQKWGFSHTSNFSNFLHEQSPEIAMGVDEGGAGDQGMMFGYACNETPSFMPLPIAMAHALTKQVDGCRESQELPWLRPDGKAQVTVSYQDGTPVGLEKIVIAVAHSEDITAANVRQGIIAKVIKPVVNEFSFNLPSSSDIVINGTGLWHIPGPSSDAGLTGRKIVVDTYGGYARVGGGAFSGKDPSKVDRSGAYAARYIAKNIVAKGYASKCEVGLAYVIGKPKPLMQTIDTFNTNTISKSKIDAFVAELIDTSVEGIISKLNLRRPMYSHTSAYGHFGKPDSPWEQLL